MNFLDLELKDYYNNDQDDLVTDFYEKVLSVSHEYKRSSGFFSSSSFWNIINSLKIFLNNQGKIKLIISPNLSEEDIKAIKRGQIAKEEKINKFIIDKVLNENRYVDQFNLLAWLIYEERLEIKFVVRKDFENYGIFHDKSAILYDLDNNKIAFHGSLNESETAYNSNFESINLFRGWIDVEKNRINRIEEAFDNIWQNRSNKWISFSIPEGIKKKIIYKKSVERPKYISTVDNSNKSIKLRDYQEKAINSWIRNKCSGILEMATGSGKTITAINAIMRLQRMLLKRNYFCGIVIVVPLKDLLEQWSHELKNFGIKSLKCYKSKDEWEYKAKLEISNFNKGNVNELCLLTTNKTYVSENFQKIINSIKRDYIFCVDEMHHLTSGTISNLLPQNTNFRLGLTATLSNDYEDECFEKVMNYFNKIVFKFSLEDAINRGYLTRYFYYPIFVELDNEEKEEYSELTRNISKYYNKDLNNEGYKSLLNRRRRIVFNAKKKITKFKEMTSEIEKYKKVLVYCGDNKDDENDSRFVDKINKIVYDAGYLTHTYVSNTKNKYEVLKRFKNNDIKVLTAIRCLDEGIDIPAVDCAFILSSNMNSKQFIQRRGRILRKHYDKKFSYIYDFIVVPTLDINELEKLDLTEIRMERKIITKELKRVFEFASLCENKVHAINEVVKVMNLYRIDKGE